MSIDLPAPVTAYFAADRRDGATVATLFTEDGTVKDEGNLHRGHAAIRDWKAKASARYNYTSEPIAAREEAGRTLVTARVAGDFPGSPVELNYAFTLAGARIASLEILP